MGVTSKPKQRFRDPGEPIYSYWEEILVECPRCRACAVVRRADPQSRGIFYARRLVCAACGMAAEKKPRTLHIGGAQDACFGLPLWLAAPCAGETFWAYSLRSSQPDRRLCRR